MLELTHSDVMGYFDPPSLGKAKFVLTFLGDYSRFATVRFLKSKAEVSQHVNQYREMNENKFGAKMRKFKTDDGGEYAGKGFEDTLKEHGIEHITSCPRCPGQNGRSERLNRTLMEMTRCMLLESGAPKIFWAEAINTACYIKKRCPTRAINNKIPITLGKTEN